MQRGRPQLEAENESAAALLIRIIALYRASVVDQCEGAAMLSRAAAVLESLQSPPQTAGRALPVRRFFAHAMSHDRNGSLAGVVDAFALAEPALAWVQNPNYTAQRMGPDFVDRYGYVELSVRSASSKVAPCSSGSCCWGRTRSTPTTCTQLRRSITLYPAGRLGAVAMARGTEPPGAIIHHAPHVPHAMRTEAEPLLALYCWMETLRSRLIC